MQHDGMTSLHWAAAQGSLEVMKTLLKYGADIESRMRSVRIYVEL